MALRTFDTDLLTSPSRLGRVSLTDGDSGHRTARTSQTQRFPRVRS